MPDPIVCPRCERNYPQRPELAGRKLRCECGAEFRLPAQTAPVPPPSPGGAGVAIEAVQAADPLRERMNRARRKQPPKLMLALVAAGVILAAAIIVAIVVWPKENGQEQASGPLPQNSAAANNAPSGQAADVGDNGAQDGANATIANDAANNNATNNNATNNNATNNNATDNIPDPVLPLAPLSEPWEGSLVDPPANRWADIIPADADWRQPAPDWATKILLSNAAGPGVMFLETGRSWFNSSTIGGTIEVPSQKLLSAEEGFRPLDIMSPDGHFVVGQSQRAGDTMRSLSVADVTQPAICARLPGPHSIPRFVEFLDNNRLIVIDRGIKEPWLVKVYALPSGDEQLAFELPALDPLYNDFVPQFAVSPGSRFLAFGTADGVLRLFEIATGELAGELSFNLPRGRWASARSVNFSPDGGQLAVWYKFDEHPGGPPNSRIVCWDLATGKMMDQHDFQASLSLRVHDRAELAKGLVWLPDQSGWIACGKWLIDRKSGEIVWALPLPENSDTLTLLRPLEGSRMLCGWQRTANGTRQIKLQTLDLPEEQIEAARAQAQAGNAPDVPDRPTEKLVDVL